MTFLASKREKTLKENHTSFDDPFLANNAAPARARGYLFVQRWEINIQMFLTLTLTHFKVHWVSFT